MPYSDRFTWAKYGHFILYSGLIPVNDKSLMNQNFAAGNHGVSLTENHRECLISFLQTDPDGAASFVVDARSARLIDDFMKNTFRNLTKGTEKGYFFDEVMETNADLIVSSICLIAMEATKIPLAIFTDLFQHRLRKSCIWNQLWNYCSSSTSNLSIIPIISAFLLVIATNIVCIVPDVIVQYQDRIIFNVFWKWRQRQCCRTWKLQQI